VAEPFRHKIGDALYELVSPYEANDAPDYVLMWPVEKVTDGYVWVRGPRHWNRDRTYRLSRAKLETDGRAWSASIGQLLYARPLPDWPLLVVDVRRAPQLEITTKEN
jgi:hypothetical protein